MFPKSGIKKSIGGFAIIEALTVLFIFCLIVVTFYSVFTAGTNYIINSKNRLKALALANEKMEIVRNLKYDNIGTVGGGSADWNIPEDEDILESGKRFHVNTVIGYVDDDYDGIFPADTIPSDYKKVIITVSWNDAGTFSNEVRLESRFVPPGLEVINPGDGILSINVFSDQPGGTGISGSNVHIANSETGLNTNQETDSSGNLILVGTNIVDSIQKYEITVTKSGYETVSTMPPYPSTPYNPTYVHASVVSGLINVTNIVQNELADLKISTVDYLNQPVGNVNFNLSGGKQIGTEVLAPNDPVYNFNESGSTGTGGEKDFNGISPGQYKFSLSSSGYEIIGTDPDFSYGVIGGVMTYLFSLPSEPSLNLKIKLADENVTSLLVKAVRSEDDGILVPVSGAQVQLKNDTGYDATQPVNSNGVVFFPVNADLFQAGTYNLKITAEGFSESNTQTTINLNQLKTETVTLTPS